MPVLFQFVRAIRSVWPTTIGTVLILAIATPAQAQSQSFAYVAVDGVDCDSSSTTAPPTCRIPSSVLVVDASSSAIVTRIPLSTGLRPRTLTISRDGSRMYVLNGTLAFPAVLSVIDTRRHQLLQTFTLETPPFCDYSSTAVDSNPAVLYLRSDCSDPRVATFDTNTGSVVANLLLSPRGAGGIERSPVPGRFLITTWPASGPAPSAVDLNEYGWHDGRAHRHVAARQ